MIIAQVVLRAPKFWAWQWRDKGWKIVPVWSICIFQLSSLLLSIHQWPWSTLITDAALLLQSWSLCAESESILPCGASRILLRMYDNVENESPSLRVIVYYVENRCLGRNIWTDRETWPFPYACSYVLCATNGYDDHFPTGVWSWGVESGASHFVASTRYLTFIFCWKWVTVELCCFFIGSVLTPCGVMLCVRNSRAALCSVGSY